MIQVSLPLYGRAWGPVSVYLSLFCGVIVKIFLETLALR
jgi:hypothetical protein